MTHRRNVMWDERGGEQGTGLPNWLIGLVQVRHPSEPLFLSSGFQEGEKGSKVEDYKGAVVSKR